MEQIKKIIRRLKSGTLLTSALFRLARPYFLSERNVFAKQERRLKRVLRNAQKHIPYYRKLFGKRRGLVLSDFPVVGKELIIPNHGDFCSDRINRYLHNDAYTGGSTGEPFHFIVASSYETQFGLRKWQTYGYQQGDRILAMDGTKIEESDLEKGIYYRKKNDEDIPFGTYALSSLYLNDSNADAYCEFIKQFDPAFLRGYPAFVYAVACYAEKTGFALPRGIKGIELTSETALPHQIEKITAVFHAPVYLQYGHTEAIVFAYSFDTTYRYRVEPLYGYVEVLDENGNHVKENEIGEVVVTTLHNFAMPLIRYRTGDYAEFGGRDQRYLYLNKVLGRTQDYIWGRDGNKVLLTALIFGQHNRAMGHIVKWQLEQFEAGAIIVHVIKGDAYSLEDEQELYNMFSTLGNVHSTFHYVDYIALTPRGKSRMLLQHIG